MPKGRLARRVLSAGLLPASALYNVLRPGVRVLMYHRVCRLPEYDQLTVSPMRFRRQMEVLASRYRVVSLRQGIEQLAAGSSEPAVAITFDDGYRDNLLNALPVLSELGLPATIFVTAAFAAQESSHPRYSGCVDRLHLNWSEIRTLSTQPGIEIGSHTCTHPFLSRLAEGAAQQEMAQSRVRIESELRMPVELFCYPSGDAGAREMGMAKSCGYIAAVTVAPGVNRPGQSPFALRRTEVTDRDDEAEFAMKLHGAFDPIHHVLHWRRQRRFLRESFAELQEAGP